MAYTEYANAITHKCQNAAALMLQTAVTGGSITLVASGSIFAGIGRSELPLPRVVFVCKRAQIETPSGFDGNWIADLSIKVYASAQDTTEDEFHELSGQVYHRFCQDPATVGAELSAASLEFTAFTVIPQSQSWDLMSDEDDAHWESELVLSVRCCGAVFA
jgi:hypothetical protein